MTRCVPSATGVWVLWLNAWQEGTITGETVDRKCWYVRWDGAEWPRVTMKEFVTVMDKEVA